MRNKILIFDFLPNSLSDAVNVCQCSGFQSNTFVWYCWGYNCESIVVWSLASMRDQILISYFLSYLFSDEQNVQQHSCLQSTTSFQYYFGYRCESILAWNLTAKYETRFWFPIFYPQLILRCTPCSLKQKPSISHYTLILPRLKLWECICME